jgi:hypothetical protein
MSDPFPTDEQDFEARLMQGAVFAGVLKAGGILLGIWALLFWVLR